MNLEPIVVLHIPDKPIPATRPRYSSGGRVYNPRARKQTELQLRLQESLGEDWVPLKQPIAVELQFRYGLTKTDRAEKRKIREPRRMSPDLDNLAKFILDAMNGVVYTDDRWVSTLYCSKIYAPENETIVTIYPDSGEVE